VKTGCIAVVDVASLWAKRIYQPRAGGSARMSGADWQDGNERGGNGAPPAYAVEVDEAQLAGQLAHLYPNGVPNLYRAIGRNPQVMGALAAVKTHLAAGVLSETERCLVGLEVAHHVGCDYCAASLCHYGAVDLGVPDDILETARAGRLPREPRLAAIVLAARAIIASHGKLGQHDIGRLPARGLRFEALLEIVAVISEYTMATLAANLDRTRIDPEFRRAGRSAP
jgi:alkylhydroperoxidase family enzyme